VVAPLERRVLRPECCAHLLGQTGLSAKKMKHIRQQSSIIGHLEDRGLLGLGDKGVLVEMGCGKGALSALIEQLPESGRSNHILVDRMTGVRNKADTRLRDIAGSFSRITIDIAHLRLAGMPGVGGKQLVLFSKHLCGAATCLTLRCALQQTAEAAKAAEKEDQGAAGVEGETAAAGVAEVARVVRRETGLVGGAAAAESSSDVEGGSTLPVKRRKTGPEGENKIDDGSSLYDGADVGAGAAGGSGGADGSRGRGESVRTSDGSSTPPCAIGGIVIATCCHQVCSWETYCNRAFIEKLALAGNVACPETSGEVFDWLRTMSSWAVCDFGAKQDSNWWRRGRLPLESSSASPAASSSAAAAAAAAAATAAVVSGVPGAAFEASADAVGGESKGMGAEDDDVTGLALLGDAEKRLLGQTAKLILDTGRVELLRDAGFAVHMIKYIDEDISPECRL
jgi:hypothetical protein